MNERGPTCVLGLRHPRLATSVRRARITQHTIATAESSAGAMWPSSSDATIAQAKAMRFAATSYAGATKSLFMTWATAMTSPQAKVTDSRKFTELVCLSASEPAYEGMY